VEQRAPEAGAVGALRTTGRRVRQSMPGPSLSSATEQGKAEARAGSERRR